jgi:hypothetical protein
MLVRHLCERIQPRPQTTGENHSLHGMSPRIEPKNEQGKPRNVAEL